MDYIFLVSVSLYLQHLRWAKFPVLDDTKIAETSKIFLGGLDRIPVLPAVTMKSMVFSFSFSATFYPQVISQNLGRC